MHLVQGSCLMDEYLTFCAARRIEWRGHDSRKKVRASIRASAHYGLRIFVWDGKYYYEVQPEDWDVYFAD